MGCSKNLVDSEVLLTQLKGNGIDASHESDRQDNNIIIINTCGFIDNAKQESIDTILQYVDAKEKGCLLYTSPSPRDRQKSRMPSSA